LRTNRAVSFASFVAIAALVALGCTTRTPTGVTTSTIVVHAVLNALDDDQVVVVQRTTAGVPQASPVDSATVTITGPDGVAMTGVEVADSALARVYRVRLSSFQEQLVPGGTYHLHVHLKTGEDVTGTTTIPNARPSLPPVAMVAFNEATDTLRLSWPAVQGAYSYEVRVQSSAGVFALFTDTSAVLPGTLRSLEGKVVFANGLDHTVIVSAVDAAYYQYYRTNSDEFTGATVQGNLSGAQGVFGSLVVLTVRALRVATTAR
jgi:hypothetical protein